MKTLFTAVIALFTLFTLFNPTLAWAQDTDDTTNNNCENLVALTGNQLALQAAISPLNELDCKPGLLVLIYTAGNKATKNKMLEIATTDQIKTLAVALTEEEKIAAYNADKLEIEDVLNILDYKEVEKAIDEKKVNLVTVLAKGKTEHSKKLLNHLTKAQVWSLILESSLDNEEKLQALSNLDCIKDSACKKSKKKRSKKRSRRKKKEKKTEAVADKCDAPGGCDTVVTRPQSEKLQ